MRTRAVVMLVAALMLAALPAMAGGRPLTADLDAANEIGTAGDPGSTGSATVTLNQGQEEVCFEIEVDLNSPAFAAHIHDGDSTVNGPVVVNFDVAANGLSGCVSADADLIKDIRQNPSDYYVNVHNAIQPSGAVRGQLSR